VKRRVLLFAVLACVVAGSAHADDSASRQAAEARRERILAYLESSLPEGTPAPVQGSALQRVRDMYASYMDTARIDSLGLKPLKEDLQKIAKASSKRDIAALYGQGNFIYAPFRVDVKPDTSSGSGPVVAISQSGLDMQTRAPYVDMDAKSVEVRTKYVEMVDRLLALVDEKDSRTRAEQILSFETEIAKVSRPEAQESDQAGAKNMWMLSELRQQAPKFEWDAYLKSNRTPEWAKLLVGQPDVIRNVARVVDETDLRVLKDHLAFSLICTWGWPGLLPQSVFDVQFDFYGRARRGATKQTERRTRAFTLLSQSLPRDLEALDRMLLDARSELPDSVAVTDGPRILRHDAYGNAKRAHVWNWERQMGSLGR
jgi:putative endopeptidase